MLLVKLYELLTRCYGLMRFLLADEAMSLRSGVLCRWNNLGVVLILYTGQLLE